jgi:hypothetical protein
MVEKWERGVYLMEVGMKRISDFVKNHTLEVIWTAMIGITSITISAAAVFAWRTVDNYIAVRVSSDFSARLRMAEPVSTQFNDNSWIASCDTNEIAIGGFCRVNSLGSGRTTKYRLLNIGTHPVKPYNQFACSYSHEGGDVRPQDISVWVHCYRSER